MIVFNDFEHADQIAEAAGCQFNRRFDHCISRERNGELLGGVVYSGYTGKSIGIHVAGFCDDWISKDMLWVCFHYPFVQLKCEVLFGQVPSDNLRALEFDRKLGFKIEARIPDVFPNADLVVLKMRKSECRWLKLKRSAMEEAA